MNPKPTPQEIYEAYIIDMEEKERVFDTVTLCDLYYQIRKRHRGYKIETFHKMLENMHLNWTNWNNYKVSLRRGHVTGVCTKYKRDRDTLHPAGWKFIQMIPLKK